MLDAVDVPISHLASLQSPAYHFIDSGILLYFARVIMAALWYRAGHYIFALWFLSIFYLLSIYVFSSPNLSGHGSDVYHTSTHDAALVRI